MGLLILVAACVALLIPLVIFALHLSPDRIGYIQLPSRVIDPLVSNVDPAKPFYDLGCGDGKVLAAVVHAYPKVRASGIEFNPVVLALARLRLHRKAALYRGDLISFALPEQVTLFTYLSPRQMALLEPKLNSELGSGSRLISCDFPLPSRKPSNVITVGHEGQLGRKLFIYDF